MPFQLQHEQCGRLWAPGGVFASVHPEGRGWWGGITWKRYLNKVLNNVGTVHAYSGPDSHLHIATRILVPQDRFREDERNIKKLSTCLVRYYACAESASDLWVHIPVG